MERLEIGKEEPKEVIKFFKEISDIPRESGNEEGIRDYLVDFAKKRNLEYYTDEYFNVIIRKPASEGYEEKPYLSFQGHTDMICEKEDWSNHNFEKDSIELIKDGDFIKANGTTLGADNGIGVAVMLAILDAKDLKGPKIECIFTVQEETTMIGAKLIDVNQIKSKRIISLDNGKEGKMVISSANCMEWYGKVNKEYIELDGAKTYELEFSNFMGGHSGGNIADVKRGNPIKIGMEILSKFDDIYLNKISGGSRVNVIPRDFKVEFSYAGSKDIESSIDDEIAKQKDFYGNNVKISLKEIESEKKAFSKDMTMKIINFINAYENGALKFDENNNVMLSANFGAINEFEDYVRLEYSLRSNNMSYRASYLENLEKQVKENDIEIVWEQELKGFEPDYTSNLVCMTSKVYKELFGKEIEKIIVQGVVEGGFFKDRMENVEYICIGANTFDVHSPKERVSISSMERTWEFIKNIIEFED